MSLAAATTVSTPVSVVGALTTIFTPSASCLTDLWNVDYLDPISYFNINVLGPRSTSDCLPPGYNEAQYALYSPGVCPSGYTTACSQYVVDDSFHETVATCCPSNYVCQKNPIGYSKDQHWCISNVTTTQPQTVNLTVLSNYSIMVVTTILSSKGWGNFHAYGVLLAEASSTDSISTPASVSASVTAPSASVTSASAITLTQSQSFNINSTLTPNVDSKKADGLTTGAKAGIAVGAIAGTCLLVAAFWYVYRAGKRKSTPESYNWRDDDVPEHQLKQPVTELMTVERPAELVAAEKPAELGPARRHELQ